MFSAPGNSPMDTECQLYCARINRVTPGRRGQRHERGKPHEQQESHATDHSVLLRQYRWPTVVGSQKRNVSGRKLEAPHPARPEKLVLLAGCGSHPPDNGALTGCTRRSSERSGRSRRRMSAVGLPRDGHRRHRTPRPLTVEYGPVYQECQTASPELVTGSRAGRVAAPRPAASDRRFRAARRGGGGPRRRAPCRRASR